MAELAERNPMAFAVTTFILMSLYGLEVQELVGRERFMQAVSKSLEFGEKHLTKSIEEAVTKLKDIGIKEVSPAESFRVIANCAQKIAA